MDIKLVCFDLDGVLADSRHLHERAMNMALEMIDARYVLSHEEHIGKYDGLSTKQKLAKLTAEKGLPVSDHNRVWRLKQEMTKKVLLTDIQRNDRIAGILSHLKELGYLVYVASNSIWATIAVTLQQLGLLEHVDFFISNEDVSKPKPNPEIYLKCMQRAGLRYHVPVAKRVY